ncbi:hypothetical protein [Arthrobacter sp. ok909]|uniref:hypothetical protein n=1 Tax=Arthrobacter sp. ok909 TaxID=1761746 RepID=UPI001C317F21|nr:hypothetical protein [Arthrobacter sp. ok909]
MMLAAALPQAAVAAVATQIEAVAPTAVPAVADPSPAPGVDDFVRPEPPAGRAKSEYTYVSAPLAGTMKTTVVTVQLADKTLAETDAAVPMAAAKASLSAANRYWAYATAGRVDIALSSSQSLHKSAATSTQSPSQIVDTVSQELGWTQSSYTALVIFIPGSYLTNGAAGMTYSNGNIGGRILMPQNSRLSTPVLTHEFGHALGMDHANSLLCGSGAMDVAAGPYAGFADPSCSIKPYGDNLDLMGISHWDIMPEISASFWEMGRFGNGNEIANLGTVSAPRTVTLTPWAGTGANRAAKFTDPKSGEVYFLELRAPVGYDAVVAQNGNRGVKITQQGGGNSSILLPPDTRASAFNGYYSNTQAWQAGQTFSTHAGTKVSIDSVSDTAATVTIRPPGAPAVGYVESMAINRSGATASLDIAGWAYDSAQPSASSTVQIYVTPPGGTATGYAVAANQARADVNKIMQVTGNHGFTRSFNLTAAGVYKVCVTAVGSSENADLGCQSLTLAATAPPAGYLESLTLTKASGITVLRAAGWSYDPGTPAASIPVHIYVTDPAGKTTSQAITANNSRSDVNLVMGVTGSHGFTTDIPVTVSGEYKVCAYGLAVSPFSQGNSLLGCKYLTPRATPAPVGYLESTVAKTDATTATITATGWTFDPGTPAAPIPVHLYVTDPGGVTTSSAYTANQARADVNQVMGTTGNHGYTVALPVKAPGEYKICAYALAVSVFPLGNSFLGCSTVRVAATPAPIGYLESLKVQLGGTGSALVASGWGMDPGMTQASIPVHLYVTSPDGTTKGTAYVANQYRADVNSVFQVSGNHGYRVVMPVTKRGTYTVCAWGLGVAGMSTGNTQFGCLKTTF